MFGRYATKQEKESQMLHVKCSWCSDEVTPCSSYKPTLAKQLHKLGFPPDIMVLVGSRVLSNAVIGATPTNIEPNYKAGFMKLYTPTSTG